MLTQVLVHNQTTAKSAFPGGDNAITDLSDLGDGQVAIWDPEEETTVLYDSYTDSDVVQLVQGTPGDRPIFSTTFDTDKSKVFQLDYREALNQITELDFTGTTIDFDGEVTIKVTDLTKGNLPEEKNTYSTVVSSGEAIEDVLQRIVDDINSRTPNINGDYGGTVVEATDPVAGDTLVLTSLDASTIFDVAVSTTDFESTFDPSLTYTKTETQSPQTPTGEGSQVLQHEESVRGMKGRHEVEDGILGKLDDVTTYADENSTYDIYNFTFDGNLDIVKSAHRPQVLVAVDTDATLDDGV